EVDAPTVTTTEKRFLARRYKPPHPGEVLRDTVLRKDGGIRLTEFAKQLDAPRVASSRIVNGKAAVSAEMAIRVAAALRGSPQSWMRPGTTTFFARPSCMKGLRSRCRPALTCVPCRSKAGGISKRSNRCAAAVDSAAPVGIVAVQTEVVSAIGINGCGRV